jgi:hypothetical protein
VDVVYDTLHSIWKSCGIGCHFALCCPFAKETVVNVDLGIAGILQTAFYHLVSLKFDDRVGDVYHIRIPAAPTHQWQLDSVFGADRQARYEEEDE